MGLLDDAIREHLELKKRHGADATEIADLEKEAFGPARRGPEPLEVPAAEPAADAAPATSVEPAAEGEPAVVEPQPEPTPEPEADALPDDIDPVASELAWEDAATEAEEPLATEPEPPPRAAAPAGEGDAEGDSEDVLEETPEFLQETPEHDRLWFEQRPPRDFDFDG